MISPSTTTVWPEIKRSSLIVSEEETVEFCEEIILAYEFGGVENASRYTAKNARSKVLILIILLYTTRFVLFQCYYSAISTNIILVIPTSPPVIPYPPLVIPAEAGIYLNFSLISSQSGFFSSMSLIFQARFHFLRLF